MKKTLLAICAAVVLLGGCTDEILPPPIPPTPPLKSDETFVTFSFGVENPVVVTRAVNENAITNLQLLLIHSDGTRYFYEPGDKRTLSVTIKRGVYKILACTDTPIRIQELSEAIITFFWTQFYNETDTSLAMSFQGTADFSAGRSSSYSVNLVRTVAKLRFNVSAASNISISRISLQSAPRQTKLFPQSNPGNSFAERAISATGGSFTLYMPENLAGTVYSITNQRQRTSANAPANATYLLIEGEVTAPGIVDWIVDKKKFESVVYLGSNVTNDFNVKRNTDYRININIASDLSTDTRIELSRVGYEMYDRWTPDRKFLLYESIPTTLYFNGSGSETVSYKCVFSGYTSGKLRVGGTYITGNTVSGTIAAGKRVAMDIVNNEDLYTPENHKVTCAMTFTYGNGETTEYREEFRFANKTGVQIMPLVPNSTARKATITCSSAESVVEDGSYSYAVYHAKRTLQITASPLSGYTFKGWYSDAALKTLIGSSSTISISVPRKLNFTVYAKVE